MSEKRENRKIEEAKENGMWLADALNVCHRIAEFQEKRRRQRDLEREERDEYDKFILQALIEKLHGNEKPIAKFRRAQWKIYR